MVSKKRRLIILLLCFNAVLISSQTKVNDRKITGNLSFEAQTYKYDHKIGADSVPQKILSNSYMNVNYMDGNFSAGLRFEGYMDAMLGYDNRYNGFDIAYRFARYSNELLDVTVGNFYEQFGNGLVFRTYEEKGLGYDNSMDGVLICFKPIHGITFKGVMGKQRLYWEKGDGTVRGIDGEFYLNDLIPALMNSKNRFILGGSFVSKYQADEDPLLILPENVGAGAFRLNYSRENFSLGAEYAYKGQDPSSDNNNIYKNGQVLLINSSYSIKGLGMLFQYKWLDNMSFRSDRNATLNDLSINYLPAITKNHTYAFTSMYPYATQLQGEVGFQGEVFYKVKKGSFLGGKNGFLVSFNYSCAYDIKRQKLNNVKFKERGTKGYKTSFLSMSDSLLNRDFSIELTKKFSRKVNGIFSWQNIEYNIAALQGHGLEYDGMVDANAFIADITWRLKPKHSLRFETQALFTKTVDYNEEVKIKQDYGNWAMLMLEYSFSPHWFFVVSDQYNYISTDDKIAENTMNYVHNGRELNRNHYYTLAAGYNKRSSRIQLSYGKQREGILCVGGVCRAVPAAYGFNISLTTTF
jgi:hypothetical protein